LWCSCAAAWPLRPAFLEKHRLRGQEKAVVKGSRLPALRAAYAEFLEIAAAAGPGEDEPEPETKSACTHCARPTGV
jgi:hypothetical protein